MPRVSLAVLFVAVQFADILWPVLVALGVEQVRIDPGNTAMTPLDFVSYPISHSLLMLLVWGLLLWNSIPATIAVEGAMFAAGVWIYARATRPKDRMGRWGLVALVVLLVLAYASAIGSPPPPSVTALWQA